MKPTILIYNDTECAVYNVFTGLQPYLELTYNVLYHDWKNTDQSYFEKEKISDVVISGVDGYYYLKTFRQLHEFKKFIIVSHGYCEPRLKSSILASHPCCRGLIIWLLRTKTQYAV